MAKTLELLLALALSALMLGCGASKTTKASTSSRGGNDVNYGTNYLLGECNRVELPQLKLSGQVGTYYDTLTHQYRTDYLNLNLTSVPAELYTSSTLQFQIFRWYERTAGQKQINTIPTRFYFVDKLTGTKTPSGGTDRLSKATIDAARAAFGSSWLNVSTTQFFDRTLLVLTGMDLQYDAITLAMYDTAIGQNAVAQGDVLIPAFYANPNIYKSSNPLPDLYNLHPNISLLGSNSLESDYYRIIEDICRDLAGFGTRIPASAPQEPESFVGLIWSRILDSLDALFDIKAW